MNQNNTPINPSMGNSNPTPNFNPAQGQDMNQPNSNPQNQGQYPNSVPFGQGQNGNWQGSNNPQPQFQGQPQGQPQGPPQGQQQGFMGQPQSLPVQNAPQNFGAPNMPQPMPYAPAPQPQWQMPYMSNEHYLANMMSGQITNLMSNPDSRQLKIPDDATNCLYVDGVPFDCKEREVDHIFRPYPGYKECRLIQKETASGRQFYFCFADFDNKANASVAMQTLQGYRFEKKNRKGLVLKFARETNPKKNDGRRDGRRDGRNDGRGDGRGDRRGDGRDNRRGDGRGDRRGDFRGDRSGDFRGDRSGGDVPQNIVPFIELC